MMTLVIGKKEYSIEDDVPYMAIRKILDGTKHLKGDEIDIGSAHDDTYEGILMLLPKGSFKNIEQLKNAITWKEYKALDKMIEKLIVGDEKNE